MISISEHNKKVIYKYLIWNYSRDEIKKLVESDEKRINWNESIPRDYLMFVMSREEELTDDNTLFGEFDWGILPEKTQKDVSEYQKQVVDEVVEKHNGRCLIAMDMGTGKTLVGLLLAHHYGRFSKRTLLIVPTGLINNWKVECERWLMRGEEVSVVGKGKSPLNEAKRIHIVSFDVCKDNEFVIGSEWDAVVIDEAHNLKGNSLRSNRIGAMLRERAKAIIMLTGTPQHNNALDNYNYLNMLYPQYFYSKQVYLDRYCKIPFAGGFRYDGSMNIEELATVLSMCKIRVKMEQTGLVLPKLTKRHTWFDPPDALFEKECNELRDLNKRKIECLSHGDVDKAFILSGEHWTKTTMLKCKYLVHGGKDSILAKYLDEKYKDKRIAFFFHNTEPIEVIKEFLDKEYSNTKYVVITGNDDPLKRQSMVNKVSLPDGDHRLILCTTKTTGTGLNFTPMITVVIFIQQEHNPSDIDQAESRIRRIGASNKESLISEFVMFYEFDEKRDQKMGTKRVNTERIVDHNLLILKKKKVDGIV